MEAGFSLLPGGIQWERSLRHHLCPDRGFVFSLPLQYLEGRRGGGTYHVHKQIGSHSIFPRVKNILQGSVHSLTTEHPTGIISRPGLGKSPHCSALSEDTMPLTPSLGGWEDKEAAAVLGTRA